MGHGNKQDEQSADVRGDDVALDNDYQTELPKNSTSARAANAGESAVVASQTEASPFRLPGVQLSSEHAREKEEEFRDKASAYNLSRGGKGTGAAAYRNLTDQANAYQADAIALEQANTAYNQLVPQSAFAFDSVVRFKAIQAELGLDFSDNAMWTVTDEDLTKHVGDRKSDLAKGISDSGMKTSKGMVSDAASAFGAAQKKLVAALTGVQNQRIGQLIKQLEAERAEKAEQKEQVEAAIESAHSVTEYVGKTLSIGGDAYFGGNKLAGEKEGGAQEGPGEHHAPKEPSHESGEKLEGAVEVAKSVDEAAALPLAIMMHAKHDAELAQLSTEIGKLSGELAGLNRAKQAGDLLQVRQALDGARGEYSAALKHYEHAIANQRTGYAKAGASADTRHAHGGKLSRGDDKASQTMLFISAARETDLVLRTALPLGRDAEGALSTALRGMRHRIEPFLEDDWRSGEPEGSRGEDQVGTQQALALTSKWVMATEKEQASFDPIEKASRKMLEKTGKTAGDY
jgi:hypothetical protein